jgi:hypothetical protein
VSVDLAGGEAQARRLLAAARDDKRAARQHRERAKQHMRQFDELVAALRARGIDVQIQTDRTAREVQSGDNDSRTQTEA